MYGSVQRKHEGKEVKGGKKEKKRRKEKGCKKRKKQNRRIEKRVAQSGTNDDSDLGGRNFRVWRVRENARGRLGQCVSGSVWGSV
jgi:hypothetical protein